MMRSTYRHLVAAVLPALALFVLPGCGNPRSAGVEGRVTFDGSPVDGGMIMFFPSEGEYLPDKAHPAINDGKYAVEAGKGLEVGKYRVQIFWKKKTGRMIVNKSDAPNTIDEILQVIPSRFNLKSELIADIKPGSNTLDFDLKSKPGQKGG